MTDLEIRELQEKDIDKCAEITVNSYPWTIYGLKKEKAMQFLSDRLNKEMVYVAQLNNEVVGFIAIKRDIMFANYIRRLVVKEDMRGKGVGAQLIKFIENQTLERNLPNVFLLCAITNENAIKFYERNGYKKIGVIENFVGEGLHEYLFWKSFGTISDFHAYD